MMNKAVGCVEEERNHELLKSLHTRGINSTGEAERREWEYLTSEEMELGTSKL